MSQLVDLLEQRVHQLVLRHLSQNLSLGEQQSLALASGVTPEKGIYTAITAGFVISFLGGSRVQIAGPTAAFAMIVAGIVAKNGMDGLIIATLLAGVILILMGLLRLGNLIKFIPYTITTGFTAGIAVTIFIGQIKDFLGLTVVSEEPLIETMDKLMGDIRFISTINVQAVIVGAVCLAILIVWPMINETIPPSLLAVIAGIAMVKGLHMPVNTIGDLYTISNALPALTVPVFNFDMVQKLLPDAFTIAILAAIESLLSCVVADGMINSKHRSNTELVAQGAGNIVSALFGGIPATGAIARTAANIKNGGRTPIAGMVHAVVLLLILVGLAGGSAGVVALRRKRILQERNRRFFQKNINRGICEISYAIYQILQDAKEAGVLQEIPEQNDDREFARQTEKNLSWMEEGAYTAVVELVERATFGPDPLTKQERAQCYQFYESLEQQFWAQMPRQKRFWWKYMKAYKVS